MGIQSTDIRLLWTTIAGITLLAHVITSMELRISPKDSTIHPGQNISILCRSDVPLHYCRIKLPGYKNAMSLNARTKPSKNFAYYGSGLEYGDCGITLFMVDDKVNGKILCTASTEEATEETVDHMTLTVLRPAKTPYFTYNNSLGKRLPTMYPDDTIFRTTCVVENGRPASKITWYLDQEVLTKGPKSPLITQNHENLFTIRQEFARRLSSSDNGKQLKCVAEQEDIFESVSEAVITFNVSFPPKTIKTPIRLYGFDLNSTATVMVDVLANPQPQVLWKAGNIELREGTKSADGRLEVKQTENMGPGKWKAVLTIDSLTERDTSKQYFLKVKNSVGEAIYEIVISTDLEPQHLSAGLSIGIGVAALAFVALIIVGIVFFKRRQRTHVEVPIQKV